jgi:DNA-binding XRE family transcriptional regulator
LLTGAEWQMLDEVRAVGGRLTYPGLRLRQTAEVLQRAGLVRVKIHARRGGERGEGPHTETITVSEVPSDMGRRLREARVRIGLSQGRLAERVGASRTTIARLEESAGKHSPSVDLALAVAGEVGQSVESLWGPSRRLEGQALYRQYAARFAYRHPLPWHAMHEHERRLWASLAGDLLDSGCGRR